MPDHPQLLLFADVLPNGSGGFLVKPKPPVEELTPKQAAKFLNICRSGIYRLIDRGVLKPSSRPTPRKILLSVADLKKHKESSKDPEFWDHAQISVSQSQQSPQSLATR